MKKTNLFVGAAVALLSLLTFSCETLKDVVGTPSLSLKSMGIRSLDLEGITFSCDYSISNPYPVAFSIKQLAADILYEGGTFTKINSDNGVSVAAMGSRTNTMTFKVPYDTILNYAKSTSGKTSLPFTLKGAAALDLSSVPLLESSSLSLPFSKDFSVPVFKPQLSVSDVKVQLPSLSTLKDALVNGGMSATKAATLAASIIGGKQLSADAFDGIDLNLDMLFNVNVANKGSAPWKYLLKNCSLKTASGDFATVQTSGSTSITSESGTIPMKVSLNTLKAGAFIVQMLNKNGSNPVFSLDSALSFTELPYSPDLPLAWSYEIPLSKVAVNRN